MWNTSNDLDDHVDGPMHSVIRGRNDYNLPEPSELGDDRQVELFLEARLRVHAGEWPDAYFEAHGIDPEPPKLFDQFGVTRSDPVAAATLVNHSMDHPLDLHNLFMADQGGIPPLAVGSMERSPQSAGVDFIGARWLDGEVAWVIAEGVVEGMQVKYLFKQTRPEHYFQASYLVAEYKCPPHWAYVAVHGVNAGVTARLWSLHTAISDAKKDEYSHAAIHHAHYRTLAGVHWPEDNEAGFLLGGLVAGQKASKP